MKKLTVISGKGGTGKTTIVSNLAVLADNLVLADCDVDAPNMHLLLKPVVKKESVFKSAKLAVKDEDMCIECGICRDVCRFSAVTPEFKINPIKCDGCAVCEVMCPEGAIRMEVQERVISMYLKQNLAQWYMPALRLVEKTPANWSVK